jgi:hypothetical protein
MLPAYSVGLFGSETGTLGCFVAKNGNPIRPLLLSNSHVLAQSGLASLGAMITQPGKDDGGSVSDVVGFLSEVVPFDFTPGFNNLCDAALATLADDIVASAEIPRIGVPPTVTLMD